jgi:hypothetical protein
MDRENTLYTFAAIRQLFGARGGLSDETFRRAVGYSRRQWRRFQSGAAPVPPAVALAAMLFAGELGAINAQWVGWRLVGDHLVDRTGTAHTPESISAWEWTAQRLSALRASENQRRPATLPPNVYEWPHRPAHAITETLFRRLEGGK